MFGILSSPNPLDVDCYIHNLLYLVVANKRLFGVKSVLLVREGLSS